MIGLFGGGTFFLASSFLPSLPAAALAILVTISITGAFHLDGLADICDGLIGGWNREERLKILKDSRHGTYGVVAIVMQLILQVNLLATFKAAEGLVVMISLHTISRLVPILFMLLPASEGHEGMGAGISREITFKEPLFASALTSIIIFPLLGTYTIPLVVFVGIGASIFAIWVFRKIGGMLGDAFGAGEQIAETLVMLFFAFLFGLTD
jgi:adenosylcobinamide-GDP ribazoletransferase